MLRRCDARTALDSLALLLLGPGCHAARVETTPAAHASTEAHDAQRDPHRALASVAQGERSLISLAAPGDGFAYALRRDDPSGEDPRADEHGSIAVTTRVCDANDANLARLTAALASHFDPDFEYVPLVCEGLVCDAHGPMEFATSLRFVFSDSHAGLALREVYEIEDVSIVEDVAAARWREAEGAIRALRTTCARGE